MKPFIVTGQYVSQAYKEPHYSYCIMHALFHLLALWGHYCLTKHCRARSAELTSSSRRAQILDLKTSRYWTSKPPDTGPQNLQILDYKPQILDLKTSRYWTTNPRYWTTNPRYWTSKPPDTGRQTPDAGPHSPDTTLQTPGGLQTPDPALHTSDTGPQAQDTEQPTTYSGLQTPSTVLQTPDTRLYIQTLGYNPLVV